MKVKPLWLQFGLGVSNAQWLVDFLWAPMKNPFVGFLWGEPSSRGVHPMWHPRLLHLCSKFSVCAPNSRCHFIPALLGSKKDFSKVEPRTERELYSAAGTHAHGCEHRCDAAAWLPSWIRYHMRLKAERHKQLKGKTLCSFRALDLSVGSVP